MLILFACTCSERVPVLQEGVQHAPVDDAEDQPHQHGHNVFSQGVREAVFRGVCSAPCRHRAAVTHEGVQEPRGAEVRHLLPAAWGAQTDTDQIYKTFNESKANYILQNIQFRSLTRQLTKSLHREQCFLELGLYFEKMRHQL